MAKSLRNAVNQMCRSCIYDEKERGTWKQQVATCTVTSCPLFPIRPLPAIPKHTMPAAEIITLVGDSGTEIQSPVSSDTHASINRCTTVFGGKNGSK